MTPESIIAVLVALSAPWVIQIIKALAGANGRAAMWLAFVISVAIGFIVQFVSAGFSVPSLDDPVAFVSALLATATSVFGYAHLAYKELSGKLSLGPVS